MAIKLNSPLKIIITILFCYFKNFLWKFERLLSSKIIEKYWLYSPCCNINLWAYLIPNSFYLPLPYYYITSPQLVTTSFLSIYVVFFFIFLFCYTHYFAIFSIFLRQVVSYTFIFLWCISIGVMLSKSTHASMLL